MRAAIVALVVFIVVAVGGFVAWRALRPPDSVVSVAPTSPPATDATIGATLGASPSASASPADSASSPSATASSSPDSTVSASPVASGLSATSSPGIAASPAASSSSDSSSSSPDASQSSSSPAASQSSSPSPEPTQTIPAEPTGLKRGWDAMTERTVDGSEAELLVRTGDINNLGYGWPPNFTPFSGESTPAHAYPCEPRPGAAPGTDRIMLGSSVTDNDLKTRSGDGYSACSKRPDNLPQAITLDIGETPHTLRVVLVQMFLDDFQGPVWRSQFRVTLNGTRIPPFEDTINALNQTGPIGKLVTLRLLPEYYPIVRSGKVQLFIDDPTTGNPDGYAVDFVRVLVNPKPFAYSVVVACTVVDADTQKPIANASCAAAQVTGTTSSAGTTTLRGVPAGLVSASANAVGYDGAVQLVDLPAGSHGTANFALHRHKENVDDLKALLKKNGSIAIYGIHFDTASAKLRPDSLASLETLRRLIGSDRTSHWIIAGHTDNQGSADYNLGLSDARAHSVVAWLVAHGIANDRLTPKGFGLTRPVADNATESGRALNRRVEVSLGR